MEKTISVFGVYLPVSRGETCIGIFDSAKECADFMSCSTSHVYYLIKHADDEQIHVCSFDIEAE